MNLRKTRKSLRTVAVAGIFAAAVLLGGASGCASVSSKTASGNFNLNKAEDAVRPALVRIHVVETNYSGGREVKYELTGSGAIISADGLVVTNHHVAGKAARLFVTLPSREEIPAELVGTDALTDIAIIRLKPYDNRTFTHASWGDSEKLEVGEPVLAMGSPLALSQSVTLGIVSNLEMMFPGRNGGMELDGEDVGSIVRWIGHDAVIFPGNSGGPLVNLDGEIVGINEIGYGLAGAIPSAIAKKVAEEIVARGSVHRAHIGTVFQPLLKSQQKDGGALISSVLKDSPASKAGLEPGDFLTSIDGVPVDARFMEDIPNLNLRVSNLGVGKSAKLGIRRGTEKKELTVTPVEREGVIMKEHEFREWGITVRNLSIWTVIDLNRKNKEGVLVTTVSNGGGAGTAKPPVQDGDVIVRVNDLPIRTEEDLRAATEAIVKGQKDPVFATVTFERSGKQIMSVAKVGVPRTPDPSVDAKKPWVPVDTQVVTRDLARQMKNPDLKGVRVTQVYGKDEAADAPLRVGDIITAIDGDAVQAAEPHDSEIFGEMIRQFRSGTKVEFSVLRDGKESKVPYELPLRPAATREMKTYRNLDFELEVREVTYLDRQDPSWKAGRDASVIVQSVTPGGWAAISGVGVGDKMLEIDGGAVSSLDDVKRLLDSARAKKTQFLVLKVQRGPHTVFVEIEPSWK